MSIHDVIRYGNNDFCLENGTGFVSAVFHGKQNPSMLLDIAGAMQSMCTYLREREKPVCILIDLRDIEKMDPQSRKVVIKAMRELDCDRIAIFGGSTIVRTAARLLIGLSGMQEKIQYFKDGEEARAWLKK